MKTLMPRVARTLFTSALLIPGMLALSPWLRTDVLRAEARQALCPERVPRHASVHLDSSRRVLVCAFTTQAHGGPYTVTPHVRRLGDTLFVSATVALPAGEHVLVAEVTDVPYHVVFGPLPRGTLLRITTRAPSGAPRNRVALDTTVRVP